ncbi:MAG: urea ABC transporter ATP-binding protein UrtD [Acidimicrobiales bacterium]
MSLLEFRDVTVDFDGFKALDNVNFKLEADELRFLIGPNGAGKTTLIDAVTGLTRPTSGEVWFDGQNITGISDHKRVGLGIGRSFQTPTIFDALTVVENLDLAATHTMGVMGRFRKRKGVSDKVSDTMERIGLANRANDKGAALGHGARRWLEMGMLIIQEPQLFLLDEPVAGMSQAERELLGQMIVELASEHTVVVIEHDMAFLRRFAQKVTVLHEGRIMTEGSVEDVQNDEEVREIYLGRSRDERTGQSDQSEPVGAMTQ